MYILRAINIFSCGYLLVMIMQIISTVSLHGSLIIQALLKYQDTKVMAKSLLKMKSEEIARVSCDQSGSHVITTFMSSPTVSAKNKLKMIDRIQVQVNPAQHRQGPCFQCRLVECSYFVILKNVRWSKCLHTHTHHTCPHAVTQRVYTGKPGSCE